MVGYWVLPFARVITGVNTFKIFFPTLMTSEHREREKERTHREREREKERKNTQRERERVKLQVH